MSIKSLGFAALALAAISVASPVSAQSQSLRPITIDNICRKPVRIWINHADGYRNWHSHGSFYKPGYERTTYLEDRGVRLKQRTDHGLYFYAESTDGTSVWDGGYSTYAAGLELPMRKATYSYRNGAYHIELTC